MPAEYGAFAGRFWRFRSARPCRQGCPKCPPSHRLDWWRGVSASRTRSCGSRRASAPLATPWSGRGGKRSRTRAESRRALQLKKGATDARRSLAAFTRTVSTVRAGSPLAAQAPSRVSAVAWYAKSFRDRALGGRAEHDRSATSTRGSRNDGRAEHGNFSTSALTRHNAGIRHGDVALAVHDQPRGVRPRGFGRRKRESQPTFRLRDDRARCRVAHHVGVGADKLRLERVLVRAGVGTNIFASARERLGR